MPAHDLHVLPRHRPPISREGERRSNLASQSAGSAERQTTHPRGNRGGCNSLMTPAVATRLGPPERPRRSPAWTNPSARNHPRGRTAEHLASLRQKASPIGERSLHPLGACRAEDQRHDRDREGAQRRGPSFDTRPYRVQRDDFRGHRLLPQPGGFEGCLPLLKRADRTIARRGSKHPNSAPLRPLPYAPPVMFVNAVIIQGRHYLCPYSTDSRGGPPQRLRALLEPLFGLPTARDSVEPNEGSPRP